MVTKYVDEYEIEATGEPLIGDKRWAAYVSIFTHSANPMHQATVYPKSRVAVETDFLSEAEAVAEAKTAGTKILDQLRKTQEHARQWRVSGHTHK